MVSRPEFEKEFRRQREAPPGAPVDDAATLREELLNAYEELRTQYEELAAVRLEVESAAARNEQLFGGATVAYLITDPQGIILDANRAAWQLFGHSTPPQPRLPIATQFPPNSRRTIRALISRATVVDEPQTGQVTIRQHDRDLELRVNVQLRTEPQSGTALLSWELVPANPSPLLRLASNTDADTSAGELGRLLSLARADLAAELSPDEDPEALLTRAVELSRRWIPDAEHAASRSSAPAARRAPPPPPPATSRPTVTVPNSSWMRARSPR
jgi:PAS domain-containing protein